MIENLEKFESVEGFGKLKFYNFVIQKWEEGIERKPFPEVGIEITLRCEDWMMMYCFAIEKIQLQTFIAIQQIFQAPPP